MTIEYGVRMLNNFKVEKMLVEIIEDDEGKVHQALRHNDTCTA